MRTPKTAALVATAFAGLLSACNTTEDSSGGPAAFPWESSAGKADVFGRALVGRADPYVPNLGLDEDVLNSDMRQRRDAAWGTVFKILEPVPLLGLAQGAELEDVELPDDIPDVPRFQTWYGLDDFKRMFQFLYEDLGPAARRVREPFSPTRIEDAFEWNAAALERSQSWPLERYIREINKLGDCPEGLSAEACDELFGRKVAGAAGGIPRISYSPNTLAHALANYATVLECLGELDTLEMGAEPDDDVNFTRCFDDEFPVDSVLVKAQWERADFGRKLPAFDTDADALQARLSGAAVWNEDGDREVDPTPDEIYTIQLRNGAVYRLAGLHIMTKELRHWQWTTLWFSDKPQTDFGADRPAKIREGLPAVWSNYKMCSVTFFDESDEDVRARFDDLPSLADALAVTGAGAPTWCSNPYLEHGRGNAATNCIGCHQHGGATVAFDFDGDDMLDPLDLERLIDDEDNFPEHGRAQLREMFPADYLYSFNRVDDFSQAMKTEVEFFDFRDGEDVRPRVDAIVGLGRDVGAGEAIFRGNCTACHGSDGTGSGFAPSLFERVPLRDDRSVLQTLIHGRGQMPAWGETFSDQQLADLLGYSRANFDPPEPFVSTTDSVERGETFEADTGLVPAGRYVATLAHDPENPGGDADLYVRVGASPTLQTFDCRPYFWGSDEQCIVDLAADDTVFIMVAGYASRPNGFRLTVAPQ